MRFILTYRYTAIGATEMNKRANESTIKNTTHSFDGGGISRFGDRLKKVINGEPYKQFAKRVDMSDKAIRDYVNGETFPSIDKIDRIAQATGCSYDWLVTGKDINKDEGEEEASKAATPEQQAKWMSIIDAMTREEIDIAIKKIQRKGVEFLLSSQENNEQSQSIEPSMTSIKTAELIELLSSDDKKYIFSLIAEAQRRSLMTDDNEQQRTG